MKYVPKYSNFEEFGDDLVESVLSAQNSIEDVKDAIAEEIDRVVAAIMREQLEELAMFANIQDNGKIEISSSVIGVPNKEPGSNGVFENAAQLEDLLNEMEISGHFINKQQVESLAVFFEQFAARLRSEGIEDYWDD